MRELFLEFRCGVLRRAGGFCWKVARLMFGDGTDCKGE